MSYLHELLPELSDAGQQVIFITVIGGQLGDLLPDGLVQGRGRGLLVLGQLPQQHLGLEDEEEALLMSLLVSLSTETEEARDGLQEG